MNHRYLLFLLQRCGSIEKLKQIHAQAITLGLVQSHQSLACKTLNNYIKLGNPEEAHKIFNHIQYPDIISWTCVINLYAHSENPSEAFSSFSKLMHSGLRPDSYSIVGALLACGGNKDLLSGKTVHGMIFRFQLYLNPIVGNSLIDMYSRNGEIGIAQLVFKHMEIKDVASWNSLLNGFILCHDLGSARQVFDGMPERNSISWTAMITGYVQGKIPIRALEIFHQMKAEGRDHATAITIVGVLSGCADIGALDIGQSVHGYINKSNLNMDATVNNALIDMYSKSGCIDLAINLFNEMTRRDVFSWTSMISGYAFHGKGNLALEVFSGMLQSGVTPNEVTFLSILSACSHARLIVEGLRLFNRMIQVYGYKPKIEHYGCMVDLLGRAGLLEEAKEFIEHMPINPDAVIWRSLLSACLVHGNLNLAKLAGQNIIKLEPDDDGVYILLLNIHSAANRQGDALKIRKLMRNQKIQKKPGCSWVEVNGVVNEFLADDVMHNASTEFYLVLEGIMEHSKFDIIGSNTKCKTYMCV